ncbi:MAG: radical SAM protein [Myxococcales bacterium]
MKTAFARPLERAAVRISRAIWPLVVRFNRAFEGPSRTPRWAPGPSPKHAEASAPPLGWPRETDSLCPTCVKEVRNALLAGEREISTLLEERPGEIKAQILEEQGILKMVKVCPQHGLFEEVLSVDPAFTRRIEQRFGGRDFLAPPTPLRNHGSATIRYGRGAVLTVDLTNRCNMMCDPCFMDANQVGYVHELEWDEIRQILDDALLVRPKRQLSVQFSGGEPTLSPHFLRAVAYARDRGFFCVQAASNGIRFAQDPDFAHQARTAGLRLVYLQFDGVSNDANAHRKIANLFDIKARAIEHLYDAEIDVVLVVTVARGVNDDQVGPVIQFALDNADKISVVSFQPVSFSGRAENTTSTERAARRYTLSHLAHDVKEQLGAIEPLADWFPLSAMGPLSDLTDTLLGPEATWGALKCGCHPSCGAGTVLFVHKRTGQWVPLTQFLNVEGLLGDLTTITDGALGRSLTLTELALALFKNYDPSGAPEGFSFTDLFKQLLSQTGARGNAVGAYDHDAPEFEWRLLFVAGMPFQDLYNYDFRRTEMCIVPYGTKMGEISFCAYNTGIGWRSIVERMGASVTLSDWYRAHERHPIYAKNEVVPLPEQPQRSQIRLRVLPETRPR